MRIRFSMPLQLLAVIVFVFLFGSLIPVSIARGLYTFSLLFKEVLSLVIPFMVFFFVLAGILSFRKNAPLVLGILLAAIFCSNALVALLSYGAMLLLYSLVSFECPAQSLVSVVQPIEPLIFISLPVPVSAIYALLAAIIIGLIFSFVRAPLFNQVVSRAKGWIEVLITYGFIPLLPLYVFGFLLKILNEGVLTCLAQQYGGAFVIIVGLQFCYLTWFYFLANRFSASRALKAIKNAFPSYITAFSTMSSTAAIPVSIKSAEQNTGNRGLADMAMPIMANMHLLGDSIVTPILAMVTMLVFLGTMPSFVQYIGFVFYFCTAMFAASGVPGGGILVMIPVLVSQLGFMPQMVSIITTLYFLLDSFGTGANVMGDGALVIIVNKILKRFKITAQ